MAQQGQSLATGTVTNNGDPTERSILLVDTTAVSLKPGWHACFRDLQRDLASQGVEIENALKWAVQQLFTHYGVSYVIACRKTVGNEQSDLLDRGNQLIDEILEAIFQASPDEVAENLPLLLCMQKIGHFVLKYSTGSYPPQAKSPNTGTNWIRCSTNSEAYAS